MCEISNNLSTPASTYRGLSGCISLPFPAPFPSFLYFPSLRPLLTLSRFFFALEVYILAPSSAILRARTPGASQEQGGATAHLRRSSAFVWQNCASLDAPDVFSTRSMLASLEHSTQHATRRDQSATGAVRGKDEHAHNTRQRVPRAR
jgi:hypothetical protein